MLTAIGAVGGVVFTGIATYYGARVSAEQLEQSREDSAKQSRAQAAAFSYWVEGIDENWTLHLQNRSVDPIPLVWLAMDAGTLLEPNPWFDQRVGPVVRFRLVTTRLAPCTELIYSPKQIDREIVGVGRTNEAKEATVRKVVAVAEVQYAFFSDRDGKSWKRTTKKLIPWDKDPEDKTSQVFWESRIHDEPQVQQAVGCDESKGAGLA
ncbi:hypothetical protein ACYCCF_29950 [Streptomyces argenteolus]|uniref:hypothetical protein n=1 Tax=Streptomyces sp. NPDC025273 TaxID=3155251 RepID=UPI0033FF2848